MTSSLTENSNYTRDIVVHMCACKEIASMEQLFEKWGEPTQDREGGGSLHALQIPNILLLLNISTIRKFKNTSA